MRVLVTGAAGFVGGHLVPRLRAQGFDVSATDRELDVCDRAAVADRLARLAPDAVVHLAALSSVAQTEADPELARRVNCGGARSVLDAALHCKRPPRVLLVGSGAEYGSAAPGAPPFDERSPLAPATEYARTKLDAERIGESYADAGLEVVRIRAFNHSGPGQSDAFALPSFARQIAEIEAGLRAPVLQAGNLDAVRDFLDVDDVVDAYVRLLDPRIGADVYNVASGVGTRIRELLDALLDLSGQRPAIECDPAHARPADRSIGDASRLRAATGWKPRVSLEQMLARLLADWRSRISAS